MLISLEDALNCSLKVSLAGLDEVHDSCRLGLDVSVFLGTVTSTKYILASFLPLSLIHI